MAERDKYTWLKDEFEILATNGMIGDYQGEQAAAYLRVSSAGQAEEGRSGLPRQLEHIHKAAFENHLYIPWQNIFFDDHSGFKFEDRLGLQELLILVEHEPDFSCIVIEYLDRLSRNADWHQGYLIERFQQAKQRLIWWQPYHSRIERAVFGAISQDAMEQSIERMKEGTRRKALSGRITAKVRKYGFVFVDSLGRGTDSLDSKWRQDTHYAHHTGEATIVKRVFEDLVFKSKSLYQISNELNEEGIKPHQKAESWHPGTLSQMVRNPIYKGEFYANQRTFEKRWNDERQKYTLHQIKKPRSEWILVPVPPVVTPELWEAAQEILKRNNRRAVRNGSKKWLLTGYLRCAFCGYRLTSSKTGHTKKKLGYFCVGRMQTKQIREKVGCDNPIIKADELEPAVWRVITEIVQDPHHLIQELEDRHNNKDSAEKKRQLDYLEKQTKDLEDELRRWNEAYAAGYLEIREWGERKITIQQNLAKLAETIIKKQEEIAQQNDLEQEKLILMNELTTLREREFGSDNLPYDTKRKIIALLVDDIIVNGKDHTFELYGVIRATRNYDGDFKLRSDL